MRTTTDHVRQLQKECSNLKEENTELLIKVRRGVSLSLYSKVRRGVSLLNWTLNIMIHTPKAVPYHEQYHITVGL